MKCSLCGAENSSNSRYCKECGQNLTPDTAQQPAAMFPQSMPKQEASPMQPQVPTQQPQPVHPTSQSPYAQSGMYQQSLPGSNQAYPQSAPGMSRQPVPILGQPAQAYQAQSAPSMASYGKPKRNMVPILIILGMVLIIGVGFAMFRTLAPSSTSSRSTVVAGAEESRVLGDDTAIALRDMDAFSWPLILEVHQAYMCMDQLVADSASLTQPELELELEEIELLLNDAKVQIDEYRVADETFTYYAYLHTVGNYFADVQALRNSLAEDVELDSNLESLSGSRRSEIQNALRIVAVQRASMMGEALHPADFAVLQQELDTMVGSYYDSEATYSIPERANGSTGRDEIGRGDIETPAEANAIFNEASWADTEYGVVVLATVAINVEIYDADYYDSITQITGNLERSEKALRDYIAQMTPGETPEEQLVVEDTKLFLEAVLAFTQQMRAAMGFDTFVYEDFESAMDVALEPLFDLLIARQDLFVAQGYSESDAEELVSYELDLLAAEMDRIVADYE